MKKDTGYFQFYNYHERKLLSKGVDYNRYSYPLAADSSGSNSTLPGYDAVSADGIDFIILRAGTQNTADEGCSVDSQFTADNIVKYRARGLKVGTFWYTRHINVLTLTSIYASVTDANLQAEAVKEANNYANTLESVLGSGLCGDIIPVIDFEDDRIDTNSNYKITSHQAFVWLKAFNDRMKVRFPQLVTNGNGGCMLYTFYNFVLTGCTGNIQHQDGSYIYSEIPRLWLSGLDRYLGTTSYGISSYPNASMTLFGGYTYWTIWQYSVDRNRLGTSQYQISTYGVDSDVLDIYNFSLNSVLVYPQTQPRLIDIIDQKASKRHTHIGEYLPTYGGTIDGTTKLIHPDPLIFKQENNVSWKIGRVSNSVADTHLAGDLQIIPSSNYYLPNAGTTAGEAETWDLTKAILFKSDGTITISGKTILTDTNLYYTKTDTDTLLANKANVSHTHVAIDVSYDKTGTNFTSTNIQNVLGEINTNFTNMFIGSNSRASQYATDINSILKSGWYYSADQTNAPVANNGFLIHDQFSEMDTYALQIFVQYNKDNLFIRRKQDGTWQSWVQVYGQVVEPIKYLSNSFTTTADGMTSFPIGVNYNSAKDSIHLYIQGTKLINGKNYSISQGTISLLNSVALKDKTDVLIEVITNCL